MAKPIKKIETGDYQPVLREPRVRKLVKIELVTSFCGTCDAMVRNISSFGIRATAPIRLQIGQSTKIKKAGYGEVSGTVRWVKECEFGMQFDQAVDVDLFDFGADNSEGHFLKKIDNGHVWRGFSIAVSSKRPGFHKR